jgi:hypothetical protein
MEGQPFNYMFMHVKSLYIKKRLVYGDLEANINKNLMVELYILHIN